jgi:N-methylhydantoinase A/oxoprolinase/acetone carboxylase beta subunit
MVTPTDVWLTLGLIDTDAYLGGRKKLNVDRARAVIEKQFAGPLGISVEAAALNAKDAVEATLAQHIRDGGFLGPGVDPASVILYSVGGGGGLLTVGVTEKLGLGAAYFPPNAAVFSAFGASTLDVAHHYEEILAIGQPASEVEATFAQMIVAASRDMRGEGFSESDIQFNVEATAFTGREAQAQVAPQSMTAEAIKAIGDFAALPPPGASYLELRLTATCAMPHPPLAVTGERSADVDGARAGTRKIITVRGAATVPIYRFDRLPTGGEIFGPAIAETEHTSILLPAGRTLRVDAFGGGIVEVGT